MTQVQEIAIAPIVSAVEHNENGPKVRQSSRISLLCGRTRTRRRLVRRVRNGKA